MPHEVVKRVGGRAYRYRVESYRDILTKKVRSRWTYIGRVDPLAEDAGTAPRTRHRTSDTRERLIDAFERVLETVSYERLTAGSVAADAGVAHGTFYRYFTDKRGVLLAAIERLRGEFERTMPTFEPPYGDTQVERERVRRWVAATLAKPAAHAALLRAYLDALETDADLRERRRERQERRVRALADYLGALDAAAVVAIPRAGPLAVALLALVDVTVRAGIADGSGPAERAVTGVSDVFDRAIFGAEARASCC